MIAEQARTAAAAQRDHRPPAGDGAARPRGGRDARLRARRLRQDGGRGGWLRDAPAGWVSLDAADNDPVRLWTYAAAALGVPLRRGPLEAAIDALAARGVPLVLDDVHVLSDAECLATLEHAARVVRPARADHARRPADPARPAARAGRARRGARGRRSPSPPRKPRWSSAPAPTRTRSSPAPRAGRPPCTSSRCGCARAAIRASCPPTTCPSTSPPRCSRASTTRARDFLVRTSVLPRLCAELCDHVLEIDDSAARLEALVAREPVPGRARRRLVSLPRPLPRAAAARADRGERRAAAPARRRVVPRRATRSRRPSSTRTRPAITRRWSRSSPSTTCRCFATAAA